jgi:hypothetical protein
MHVINLFAWLISHQRVSLRTNQSPATSQQYFSLRINQHQQPPDKRTVCMISSSQLISPIFRRKDRAKKSLYEHCANNLAGHSFRLSAARGRAIVKLSTSCTETSCIDREISTPNRLEGMSKHTRRDVVDSSSSRSTLLQSSFRCQNRIRAWWFGLLTGKSTTQKHAGRIRWSGEEQVAGQMFGFSVCGFVLCFFFFAEYFSGNAQERTSEPPGSNGRPSHRPSGCI